MNMQEWDILAKYNAPAIDEFYTFQRPSLTFQHSIFWRLTVLASVSLKLQGAVVVSIVCLQTVQTLPHWDCTSICESLLCTKYETVHDGYPRPPSHGKVYAGPQTDMRYRQGVLIVVPRLYLMPTSRPKKLRMSCLSVPLVSTLVRI